MGMGITIEEGRSAIGQFVDERGDDSDEEHDNDDVETELDTNIPAIHLSGLLVGLPDLPLDLVALHEKGVTMLIWLAIFSFWSPNSRMILLLVFCV